MYESIYRNVRVVTHNKQYIPHSTMHSRKFVSVARRSEAQLNDNHMKEEFTFWFMVLLLTTATIIIIGEITGLVDGFIRSFE